MTMMTVKESAKVAGVSERRLYMSRAVVRSGRQDLVAALERGEMKTGTAYRLARGQPKETRLDRLKKAWRLATPTEREQFIMIITAQPAVLQLLDRSTKP